MESGEKKRKVRENLLPFEQMQVDTKYILDQDSLPREVYEHIKVCELSIYQWSLSRCGHQGELYGIEL